MAAMNFKQLAYFVAVADAGSFTVGAARLGVGQPAASAAIRRLESELGVELLRRAGPAIELTHEGETLLPGARRCLAAADAGAAAVRAVLGGHQGTIRIAASAYLPGIDLGAVLAAFRLRHRLVELRTSQLHATDRSLAELLRSGAIDIALVADVLPVQGAVRVAPLTNDAYRLWVAADHPLATVECVPTAALANEQFVALRSGHSEPSDLAVLLAQIDVPAPIVCEVHHLDMLVGLVRAGEVVTILPEALSAAAGPGIRLLTVDADLPPATLRAVTSSARPLSPAANELLDDIVEATRRKRGRRLGAGMLDGYGEHRVDPR
ncbi:LysR family transcriptional regulator [Conexibacter stalactiti]|uniref:LysR family transcriptional regulator n=1 Tax=Conexibacter stalactiti TaxID=1940611 RepID=A0ABU4HIB3_9ACTN|nr:LysR family transcriptional regulator [Conexibacter stalactiti]MDW5593053.1 LysR family transcriptional regulator [Conexibacter stalactiti]MEC5033694.1 LysR family transcriptional regulator [Conexibacter stalactiti]